MSSFRTLLLLLFFVLHSFASPWGPFGALKRALADNNQHERRGETSSAAYGQWSPSSEAGGAQLSGWSPQTVTTTGQSWKTATSEKYQTRTITEETCSASSPSTIFSTIVSTQTISAPAQTILSTVVVSPSGESCTPGAPVIPPSSITEEETTTIFSTVTHQVPTTILSTIVSEASCSPLGPIIPPTTIVSTIAGPTITLTSVGGSATTVTQTQYCEFATASRLRSLKFASQYLLTATI